MPRKKKDNAARNEDDLPSLMDPQLIKGLGHPMRQHILLVTLQREASPGEMAELFGVGVSKVAYHVKVLCQECELIRETRTAQRRGAIEHFYRTDVKTLFPARMWRRLGKELHAVAGGRQASDLFDDLAEAVQAGKLKGDEDHISRTPLVLDAEGKGNVKAIAKRASKEVEGEQQAAAKRMRKAKSKANPIGYIFAILGFEAAWKPKNPYGSGTEKGR